MGEQLESYELRSDEITTAVETAGSAEKKVAAHAYGNQGIRNALAAGVHPIEHGSYLDDEIKILMSLFEEKYSWPPC